MSSNYKRAINARRRKYGESYSTARHHVLAARVRDQAEACERWLEARRIRRQLSPAVRREERRREKLEAIRQAMRPAIAAALARAIRSVREEGTPHRPQSTPMP